MIDEILIRAGFGATVFLNDSGGITMDQDDFEGQTDRIVLTVDEARLVASALLRIANEIAPNNPRGACDGNP